MQITITKQMLVEKEACEDGVAAFGKLFGESVTLEWTREKQMELLRTELRKFFSWAVNEVIIPAWSMSGADLSRADLSRADLSGADLSGADLSGADLSRADLSGADLSRADLSGANLSGADLSGAKLSGADLSRADLSGADLSRAYLYGAYLYGADLSRAINITLAIGIPGHMKPEPEKAAVQQ